MAGTAAWTPDRARIVAHRAVDAATATDAGPVHLNWPLREPLEPVAAVPVVDASVVDTSVVDTARPEPHHDVDTSDIASSDIAPVARGVIVVGPDAAPGLEAQRRIVEAALRAGARVGWPVIGEPISGVRRAAAYEGATRIAHADQLLRIDEIAEELCPDLVVRVGASPTTKPVRLWLERHRPPVTLLDPARRWNEASLNVTQHVTADPVEVLRSLGRWAPAVADPGWSDRWAALDRAAAEAIDNELSDGALLSATVVRVLADAVPAGTVVMASNSMPVRDLDSFVATEGPEIDFVGNRGASGIDGITSTALGLASRHPDPVVAFVGDLAPLHDLGALVGATRAGVHLTIVCVDNDGGGIFSMLPIAARDDLDFETLFRTPHGLDLRAFDGIGGVRVSDVATVSALRDGLAAATTNIEPGVDLLIVAVDPDSEIAQRRSIAAAVQAAVT